MNIKAVFCDFAGVLLHAVDGTTFAERLGFRLDVDGVRVNQLLISHEGEQWDKGEMDDDSFYAYLLSELHLPMEKKAIIEDFIVNDFYVQPELLAFIHEVHKAYTTVLVTNFTTHLHKYLKTDWHIDGAFDHIVASCDVRLVKPEERIYQIALDKAGCLGEEAVFIDDRQVNIDGAENLGMKGILYQNTPQTIQDFQKIVEIG